ncbi:MCE family protein [Mycobacterium sp. 48b]|uniref:MCE family protein n=1 Tax=Mycobacterium sp. 48b TaxID=3400426 RepID=UPI003AAC3D12
MRVVAIALVSLLLAGLVTVLRANYFGPTRITALFTSVTGIYPGDEVRVAGVRVGTIASIKPAGAQVKVALQVDHGVSIPAEAKAVIVAQSLVAARYVQLAPAYEGNGPTMSASAVIPVDRTAIPVEWDEVKTQLTRLAAELGPHATAPSGSASRFIESAANAMDGNGDKLRQAIHQLSGVGRILADGSGNLVDVLTNLQTFVTTLRDSNTQIVQFQNRFATLTSVVNDGRSNLDGALTNLSSAVGDVQRFIAGTRDQTAEQMQRLANVTQTLADHKTDLENLLHAAPNAMANSYNIYNPDTGTNVGGFVLNNLSSPIGFICGAIGAVENITAPETAKLCAQYLGPALQRLNFNYLPFPVNPYLMKSASPGNLIYTDPALAPGGSGATPVPPDTPPAVSAYTGAFDAAAPPAPGQPPAVVPGPTAPDHLPAEPSPALYPGAPIPTPSRTVNDMLLPAEQPAP